ncbi:hypothetical protein ACHAQC_000931 [Fusarium culmorum]
MASARPAGDVEARQFGSGLGSSLGSGLGSDLGSGFGGLSGGGLGGGLGGLGGSTRNDLEQGAAGSCPKAIFIFARATTEQGNMGMSTGPAVASKLEAKYGKGGVWVQGVGGPYTADVPGNLMPDGSSPAGINEAVRLYNMAHEKCPDTPVVTGGYSQGTALVAAAISKLDAKVMDQVKGCVLFGYTKNAQNNDAIPNYPKDRTAIYCNVGDAVCTGTLIITAAHFMYQADAAGPAPEFLISKIG